MTAERPSLHFQTAPADPAYDKWEFDDKPREECGVFGVFGHPAAAAVPTPCPAAGVVAPSSTSAVQPCAAHPGAHPTAAARAARSLADGLLLTVEAPYPGAAAKLGQAIAVDYPAGQVLPDSAPALITLVALHGGDPVRARSVIGRAVRTGGDALFDQRHRLLLAWVKMQDGHLSAAAADVAALDRLHRRDALWAAALRTAIARRGGDPGLGNTIALQ